MASGKLRALKREGEKRRSCQLRAEAAAAPESWLGLEDDELLHRIETLGSEDVADQRLMEIITSDRHFFVRQEAAKRIRDPHLLAGFEGDRHIGQILVRHLNRVEDLAYLERLVAGSQHLEVRKAASAQLELLRRRLEQTGAVPRLKLDEAPILPQDPGVDGTLLGGTHAELLDKHPSLNLFQVHGDARVTVDLSGGGRLPREAVAAVATWVQTFRGRVHRMVPDAKRTSVREMTRLMAGPFESIGLYAACDAIEARRRA
jgi:hypothetical protein